MAKLYEENILWLLAKIPFTEENKKRIKGLLSPKIDWHLFINLASSYDILPLLATNLLSVNCDCIPYSVLEKFSQRYRKEYTKNNLILWSELNQILERAKRKQIKIIPIKGIISTVTLYNDIGLRRTSDIDFLIKKEDLGRIIPELEYLKYMPMQSRRDPDFHLTYEKIGPQDTLITLNAHWDLLDTRKRINCLVRDFWANAKSTTISARDMLTLSYEDMLFLCMIELYKDLRKYRTFLLKRHLDISQVLYHHSEKINWSRFIERANLYGIKTLVFYALSTNKKAFKDKKLGEEIMRKLDTPTYKKIFIRKVLPKLGFSRDNSSLHIKIFYNFIAEVLLLSRPKVFFGYLFRWAYPETSLYKNKLHLFYYLVSRSLKIPWLILKQIFKKREKCY